MIELEIFGAMDLNFECGDYTIEELQDSDLGDLYEELVEADQRESYLYHNEDLKNISIEADGIECKLNFNEEQFDLQDKIRIFTFYYYDDTEYVSCEMEHESSDGFEININIESLCEGIKYIDSIKIKDGHSKELDSNEVYFELNSAQPCCEEAGMQKIYICTKSGIKAQIVADSSSENKKLFIQAIKALIK